MINLTAFSEIVDVAMIFAQIVKLVLSKTDSGINCWFPLKKRQTGNFKIN